MPTETKRSAVDVLLELLEFEPDAGRLEHLLEAENLLRILIARGVSKDEVRAALKTKLPGELLLEVFRGGAKTEELLVHCPPLAAEKSGKPQNKEKAADEGGKSQMGFYAPPAGEAEPPSVPAYPPSNPFQEVHGINKVAAYALLFVVLAPAMLLSGFSPEARISPVLLVAIATMGSVVCGVGFVKGRAPLYVGAIGGFLVAPGALIAIALWTSSRSSVFRIEIALAFFVGAAPGLLAYYFLFKNAVRSSAR